MALIPATVNDGPLFAEVDMGADSSAPTVRATVVQASTVFYDTPATLGSLPPSLFSPSPNFSLWLIWVLSLPLPIWLQLFIARVNEVVLAFSFELSFCWIGRPVQTNMVFTVIYFLVYFSANKLGWSCWEESQIPNRNIILFFLVKRMCWGHPQHIYVA